MNTSEQITALLHGELTDDRSVAELMHILSVSPERRSAFLEHIKVSRQLLRSGRSIAPPPTAAGNLLATIAAMEPGIIAALPADNTPVSEPPLGRTSDWRKWSLLLLLLLSCTAGGYLFGSRTAAVMRQDRIQRTTEAVAGASSSELRFQQSAPAQQQTATDRQETNAALTQWKNTSGETTITAGKTSSGTDGTALRGRIAELTAMLERERNEKTTLYMEVERLRLEVIVLKGKTDSVFLPQNSAPASSLTALQSGTVRDLPFITPAEAESNSRSGGTTSVISPDRLPHPSSTTQGPKPWRVELRQHLRSSLPGVQGLDPEAGIFSDREVGVTTEFTAMQRSIRFGVAVGGTTFAQVYHTNTGGALNDTIIEQTPHLIYGRVYAAPRIFEGTRFSSALEIGVGGTEIGPVGTAGLNLEYKLADRLTIQTGVSSWLLWTSFRNQMHTSTNLNAHIGISVSP